MKKPTLTIGIPAYNEELSIPVLLRSIYRQRKVFYSLKSIIIVVDGSTDKTLAVVKQWKKKLPQITIINRNGREGKYSALNIIYTKAKTDYLLTVDADTYFEDVDTLQKMIVAMEKNPKLNLLCIRLKPIMPRSYMGKFAAYSYLILEDVTINIDSGNNYYTALGLQCMPKRFYKSFLLPRYTLSDQCYVYAKATQQSKNAYWLVKDVFLKFMPVQTFYDWRILGIRSVKGDRDNVVSHFGKVVLQSYSLSKVAYCRSVLKFFFRSPLNTVGSISMDIFIRLFPLRRNIINNGKWEITRSSKQLMHTI